ncbi:MAG: hypothetical protein KJP23_10455 [Deltaproteobacteria bacterium]|nr:hypothetical protein [Deltaproteobacteria bacterium]
MGLRGFTTTDLESAKTAYMALLSGSRAAQVTVGGTTIIYHRPPDVKELMDLIIEDIYGSVTGMFIKAQIGRPD